MFSGGWCACLQIGFNWGAAGVSTSVWKGVLLRDVLLKYASALPVVAYPLHDVLSPLCPLH